MNSYMEFNSNKNDGRILLQKLNSTYFLPYLSVVLWFITLVALPLINTQLMKAIQQNQISMSLVINLHKLF